MEKQQEIILNRDNMKVIQDILKDILAKNIKVYFPYFASIIFISSIIFVFLPEYFSKIIYINEFKEAKKEWFGISLVISFSIIFVIILINGWKILKINNLIKDLDLEELKTLYYHFYKTGTNTAHLADSYTIGSLVVKEIIIKMFEEIDGVGNKFSYYAVNPNYKKALYKRLKRESKKIEDYCNKLRIKSFKSEDYIVEDPK